MMGSVEPPNIPPLKPLPSSSSLSPSLSLRSRFFRLVQQAWHSSQSAKTLLPGEIGKPPSDRGAWSTPQASSDRICSVPLDQSARHVTWSRFVARSNGTMWRQSGGQRAIKGLRRSVFIKLQYFPRQTRPLFVCLLSWQCNFLADLTLICHAFDYFTFHVVKVVFSHVLNNSW